MPTRHVFKSGATEVLADHRAGLLFASDSQISIVQVRHEEAIPSHPSGRPLKKAKLVADVMEAVNTRDQIKPLLCLPCLHGCRNQTDLTQASWYGIEHGDEIHTEQLDSGGRASSFDGSGRLEQCPSGAATKIEPRSFPLVLKNIGQKFQGVKPEICFVTIRAE
ncbi:hypothetical protein MOP44_20360 [Occallatibacter riparius]|uniref:Uncharacterized protein n=1 Tax=Occallatibacter riparius TaxID=1002689 RepID=A0A9J7BJR6_9BACT|nr:hypothetical protein [Occallatibacter riparius]UWZ82911.1 hypothetical protein MOP44_20360 [Occallatibacter riparius]